MPSAGGEPDEDSFTQVFAIKDIRLCVIHVSTEM